MILVIDVGNTRLKWAWLTSAGLTDQQSIVHRGAKASLWTTAVFAAAQTPERVLVANVAGEKIAKTIARQTRKRFGLRPEFVTSSSRFQELANGYLDPALLGVDRWLALVGAWTIARSAFCVLDAGTAVKVDGVDATGQHLGGLIAPGIHMMRESLFARTSDIARAAVQSTPSMAGVLANNTVGAVSRGAVFALAGLAERAIETIEQSAGVRPRLFLTGGDAGMVATALRSRGEIVPDLVLRGLAAIAAQPRQPT
ncbi:MAG: type III pantothenate kinase [Gammaproteobacteria bacterium]|nr:type III pantothenate kinase [Gammaproteobacteria bacterium]